MIILGVLGTGKSRGVCVYAACNYLQWSVLIGGLDQLAGETCKCLYLFIFFQKQKQKTAILPPRGVNLAGER